MVPTLVPIKMVPIVCPETSVTNRQSTLRTIPEEQRLQITLICVYNAFRKQHIISN